MLTAVDLEKRRGFLTASDFAAVMGFDPFKNAADVLLEKTSDLEPSDAGEAALVGDDFEVPLIRAAARKFGYQALQYNIWRVKADGPGKGILAGTLDAITTDPHPPAIIEAKTTGLMQFARADVFEQWGEDGTDDVPQRVLIQATGQLLVTPAADRVNVVALVNGLGLKHYLIHRDGHGVGELAKLVEEQCTKWWMDHVKQGLPLPSDAPGPSLETAKRLRVIDGEVIDLTGDERVTNMIWEWEGAKKAAKECVDSAESLQAQLRVVLGTAEAAKVMVDGQLKLLTNKQTVRKSYVCPESTFRTLRVVKGGGK